MGFITPRSGVRVSPPLPILSTPNRHASHHSLSLSVGKITTELITLEHNNKKVAWSFVTKYMDQETGIVNFGHRYYNSQSGRWLSQDPIAPENGINLYSYVVNAPTNFTDRWTQIHERGFYREKGRRYDESSPNWDFASGGLDRIYHGMTLCVPKLSMDRAQSNISKTWSASNTSIQTSRGTRSDGNRGHFAINDLKGVEPRNWLGNSIDVIFYTRFAHTTAGGHDRKRHLWVAPFACGESRRLRTTSSGKRMLSPVITEAYDQANGYSMIAELISCRARSADGNVE